jgi:hypothetical protein
MASSTACTNPICAQFRIQHKNITLKRLELEKELDQMRRIHTNEFHQAIEQRSVTPVRDAATGEMGLMMRNGEVITPDKIAKRMEIAATCMATLQATEKHNRQLAEENRFLKQTNEATYGEMRRLERLLSGFEQTRRFQPFTDELHKQTLERNEQLAAELDRMERAMHALQEELAALRQQSHRQSVCAPRILDEEEHSIVSFIASDGRIPAQCPCDALGCREQYDTQVIGNESPTEAFVLHMSRTHKVGLALPPFRTAAHFFLPAVHPLQAVHQGRQAAPRGVVQPENAGQNPKEKGQAGGRLAPEYKSAARGLAGCSKACTPSTRAWTWCSRRRIPKRPRTARHGCPRSRWRSRGPFCPSGFRPGGCRPSRMGGSGWRRTCSAISAGISPGS